MEGHGKSNKPSIMIRQKRIVFIPVFDLFAQKLGKNLKIQIRTYLTEDMID
jgi:hypothetical protein